MNCIVLGIMINGYIVTSGRYGGYLTSDEESLQGLRHRLIKEKITKRIIYRNSSIYLRILYHMRMVSDDESGSSIDQIMGHFFLTELMSCGVFYSPVDIDYHEITRGCQRLYRIFERIQIWMSIDRVDPDKCIMITTDISKCNMLVSERYNSP